MKRLAAEKVVLPSLIGAVVLLIVTVWMLVIGSWIYAAIWGFLAAWFTFDAVRTLRFLQVRRREEAERPPV